MSDLRTESKYKSVQLASKLGSEDSDDEPIPAIDESEEIKQHKMNNS